ncbi:8058_t:CDS:2, partial [Gigaspora margarita]
TSIQPNLTGTQPHILQIKNYDDNSNTAVVRIGRVNYQPRYTCYEQRLLLRVIKADGSVIPINYENATEIQDINYCTTNWYPNEFVVNNITPKKGFLRLSTINGNITNPEFVKWSQYEYNGNGSFSLLAHGNVSSLPNPTSFHANVFATLDGGYALVYANTTSRTFTSNNTLATQFYADAGIYAIMLGYNQSKTPQPLILYQLTNPNLNFTRLSCSVDYVYIGHSCIASVTQKQTFQIPNVTTTVIITTTTPTGAAPTVVPVTTTISAPPTTITNSENFYVKIRFLSTGSVLALDPMFPKFPQNNGSLTTIKSLPYGGYALINQIIFGPNVNFTFELYDEFNALANYDFPISPLTINYNGAFDILQNNTMLVALNETTTSWRILSVQLPSLSPYNGSGSEYSNLHVNGTYPPKGFNNLELNSNYISITYQDSITFNDGSLKIYQKTSDGNTTLRQLINTKSCNLGNGCNVSDNVVTLKVLANIQSSSKRAGDIQGVLRLTNDGTQYFNGLSKEDKDSFFDNLIKELKYLIPTENGRLSTDKHTQKDPNESSKIIISISISEAKGSDKMTTTQIQSNLILLITNKEFTGISTGSTTKYLDETYGYQRHPFAVLFSEKSDAYVDWFVQYGRVAVTFALASGANIDTLLILRSNLMNIEMFRAPFSDASLTTIFWGACADALLTEIPQFIIQIIYINSSVLFDAIPIFALVASGLSVLASITSKIFFIRYKAYSPYLSRFVEKRRTSTIEGSKVNKQTYDTIELADTTDGN